MTRTRRSIPIILVSLLAGAALWWSQRVSTRSAPVVAVTSSSELREMMKPRPIPRIQTEPGLLTDASYGTVLELFREWSAFPPHSRPIDESHDDIAAPFITAVASEPLGSSNVACTLQPLRHTVTPGEKLEATISCRRGRGAEQPSEAALPLVIEDVAIDRLDAGTKVEIRGQTFVDNGLSGDAEANDSIYTISLPVTEETLGDLRIRARVRLAAPGEKDPTESRSLTASLTATWPAPARFTGKVRDRVEAGSLIIDVEIEVETAGRYRLMANLESNGSLIAYTKDDRDLMPGRQMLPLLFFGKILTDAAIEGALTVTNLRGVRFNLDPAPADTFDRPLRPIVKAHTTNPYTVSDFSSAEWDSDYKRDRLAELERLASKERQASGPSSPQP